VKALVAAAIVVWAVLAIGSYLGKHAAAATSARMAAIEQAGK
jgi:hypothetical protein